MDGGNLDDSFLSSEGRDLLTFKSINNLNGRFNDWYSVLISFNFSNFNLSFNNLRNLVDSLMIGSNFNNLLLDDFSFNWNFDISINDNDLSFNFLNNLVFSFNMIDDLFDLNDMNFFNGNISVDFN